MKTIKTILILFILPLAHNAIAAEEDFNLWSIASVSKPLTDNTYAGFEMQSRFSDDVSELERLVYRPSFSYRVAGHHILTLGYDAHDIQQPSDKFEHRPWQQYQYKTSFGHAGAVGGYGRIRLEERIIENTDGVAVRLRFKAGSRIPIHHTNWHFIASDEIAFGLNELNNGPDNGFDENRVFLGIGSALTRHIQFEIGYQSRYIERRGNDLLAHQLLLHLHAY